MISYDYVAREHHMDACWHASFFGSNENVGPILRIDEIMNIVPGRISTVSAGDSVAYYVKCKWCETDKSHDLPQSTWGVTTFKLELEELGWRLSMPGRKASLRWWSCPTCAQYYEDRQSVPVSRGHASSSTVPPPRLALASVPEGEDTPAVDPSETVHSSRSESATRTPHQRWIEMRGLVPEEDDYDDVWEWHMLKQEVSELKATVVELREEVGNLKTQVRLAEAARDDELDRLRNGIVTMMRDLFSEGALAGTRARLS